MKRFSIKKKYPIWQWLSIVLAVMILLISSWNFEKASKYGLDQERQILNHAVARSITECYALEGMYPPNIAYLTEHYGLTYDEQKFFIDYQYIGGNLRPQVTIIERN